MSVRVWVITGTSSGLGQAMAEHALAQGDKVIGTVRSLDKFPASLKDRGAQPLVLDLLDTDVALQSAAARAPEIYGHVDVLVNNAGTNGAVAPVEEVPLSAARQQFQENVFGLLAFTQPSIAHFRVRRSGHIINMSSLAAILNVPSFGTYCASKAAVDSYTEALAAELAIYGVRVHVVQPGSFPTKMILGHPLYVEGGSAGMDNIPVSPNATKVYTDASQGYNFNNVLPRANTAMGKWGEPKVLAERVFELVADTGVAKELGVKEKGWVRILMGSDSGEGSVAKLEALQANFKGSEKIWRSTDAKRA